jgi:hypothetical protein
MSRKGTSVRSVAPPDYEPPERWWAIPHEDIEALSDAIPSYKETVGFDECATDPYSTIRVRLSDLLKHGAWLSQYIAEVGVEPCERDGDE